MMLLSAAGRASGWSCDTSSKSADAGEGEGLDHIRCCAECRLACSLCLQRQNSASGLGHKNRCGGHGGESPETR